MTRSSWIFFDTMDMLFPLLFMLVFGGIIVVFVVTIFKNITQYNQNNRSPKVNVPATVVAMRADVSHGGNNMPASTSYYVTFEFTSGDRAEFYVPAQQYGMIAAGDRGELYFQGTRFLGFERQYKV